MASAFGFVGLEYLFKRRISDMDRGIMVVRDAIAKTVAFHNQQADTFTARFASPVDVAQELFEMPGGGRFQPLDEHGVPLPSISLAQFPVAYPIRGGGDAMGNDRIARAHMTVEDANNAAQDARIEDKNFLIDHMLAAMLTSTSYQYLDKKRLGYRGVGEITVQPLANGDGTTYLSQRGRGTKVDNHYFAVEGRLSAANNPFRQFRIALTEHTANPDSPVDVYVAENLVAEIEALPGFREPRDVNVTYGSGISTVAKADVGIGDEYIGYIEGCNIISAARLPDDYMLGHLRGSMPLGQRQYPSSTVQGLFVEEHSPDGAHMETRWLRYTGFGCRNRAAAFAAQVGLAVGGVYTTPEEYAAPLTN